MQLLPGTGGGGGKGSGIVPEADDPLRARDCQLAHRDYGQQCFVRVFWQVMPMIVQQGNGDVPPGHIPFVLGCWEAADNVGCILSSWLFCCGKVLAGWENFFEKFRKKIPVAGLQFFSYFDFDREICKFVTLYLLQVEESTIKMHNCIKMIHRATCTSKKLI